MSLLFAHPAVAALYLALATYAWSFRSGVIGRRSRVDAAWALWSWPLVVVAVLAPLVAGPVLWAVEQVGLRSEADGVVILVLYLLLYVVPGIGLTLAAPRWLLPSWIRSRCVPLPDTRLRPEPGAVPALHVQRQLVGGGRWVRHLDAVPGFLWVDGAQLHFRAAESEQEAGHGDERLVGLLDDEVAQLDLQLGAELRLQPPRGGWWTRRRLEVDLDALDLVHVRPRRPWTRDGLVNLRVEGRPPICLVVADATATREAIAGATGSV